MAVADTSLSTSMEAISLGSIEISGLSWGFEELVPCSAGTPSMTYNGSLFAVIDPVPRTRTRSPPPGSPVFEITCTPAALPCSPPLSVTVGAAAVRKASPEIDATAPVRSRFSTLPYPIATIGFSSIGLRCNRKSTTVSWPSCTAIVVSPGVYPSERARRRYVPTRTPAMA